MKSILPYALTAANALTISFLGICYTELLFSVLGWLHPMFPEAPNTLNKMVFTGLSSSLSVITIVLFNSFITKQNHLLVGVASGTGAFIYFYIMKFWGELVFIIMAFFSLHSAFAFIAFVFLPVLAGFILNKKNKIYGFKTYF